MNSENPKRVTRSAVRQLQNTQSQEQEADSSTPRKDAVNQEEQEVNENGQFPGGTVANGGGGDFPSVSAGSVTEGKPRTRGRPPLKAKTPASQRRRAADRSKSVPKSKARPKKRKRDETDGGEEWEVENILNKRVAVIGGAIEYLVKWKHYPMEGATWEPLENVAGCVHVDTFENRLQGMAVPPVQVFVDEEINRDQQNDDVALDGHQEENAVLIPPEANEEENLDVEVLLVIPYVHQPQLMNPVAVQNQDEHLPAVLPNELEEGQDAYDGVIGQHEMNEGDAALDNFQLGLALEEVNRRGRGIFYESVSDFVYSVVCTAVTITGMLTISVVLYALYDSHL